MATGFERKVTSHDLFGAVEGPASWRPGEGVHVNGKLREPVSFGWVLVCLCQTHVPPSLDPLVTSRLQTVSGYLYPSQSQVPERPCLVHLAINMRYIGGIDALVGGRNLAWKFMVLECTSSMGSVTCTRLPTCLTDVGFGQRFT